jgi:hypothetical protein
MVLLLCSIYATASRAEGEATAYRCFDHPGSSPQLVAFHLSLYSYSSSCAMRSFLALAALVAAAMAAPEPLITPAPDLHARGTTIINIYTTITAPRTDCAAVRPGTTCIADTGPTATLWIDGFGANQFTTSTVYSIPPAKRTAAPEAVQKRADVTITQTNTVTVGPCAVTLADPHQTLFTTATATTSTVKHAATNTIVYEAICTRADGTFLNGCSWPTVSTTIVGHQAAPTFAGARCST